MSDKHTCCARIYSGYVSSHACGKGAAYEHEGKWYCKTHHPPTVRAKGEARTAKWRAEWAEEREREKAAAEAAAEQKRKAEAYDQLAERNAELVAALRKYESVREDMFGFFLSNGLFNAWGKCYDCSSLNDAHLQATAALAKCQPKPQEGKT